jgi:N utilization substance protein A
LGGVQSAYEKHFPEAEIKAAFNLDGELKVLLVKEIVESGKETEKKISLRSAKKISSQCAIGEQLDVPLDDKVGRIDIVVAKKIISEGIRRLEQNAVYEMFKGRVGSLTTGIVHKRERSGYSINLGDVVAFLPNSCAGFPDGIPTGYQVRAIIKEVVPYTESGAQVILDRASAVYVLRLLELEIPEIFEGVVEVKRIERICGYKTKIAVFSKSKNIDAVGSCIGVGGVRIKPVIKELGDEKVDLISWDEDLATFVAASMKPAKVDRVEINHDDGSVNVWVLHGQKAVAVGKMGFNVILASKLAEVSIKVHEEEGSEEELFCDSE